MNALLVCCGTRTFRAPVAASPRSLRPGPCDLGKHPDLKDSSPILPRGYATLFSLSLQVEVSAQERERTLGITAHAGAELKIPMEQLDHVLGARLCVKYAQDR